MERPKKPSSRCIQSCQKLNKPAFKSTQKFPPFKNSSDLRHLFLRGGCVCDFERRRLKVRIYLLGFDNKADEKKGLWLNHKKAHGILAYR
jgi:hypothetical protein